MQFTSSSESETKKWASELIEGHFGDLAEKAIVITLEGEMGSGKTQFAKGVAESLGVENVVPSPTYVLTREHLGQKGRLIHTDCWRTPKITAAELDLESYLQPGTVVVIEWPAPLLEYLAVQEHILLIQLQIAIKGDKRVIKRTEA